VEDNGYGMTPEYLETIFDAFTRAENSTTNKVQGTGLGMAITKSIVELMGGTIDVSSEVNRGSLFQVELELRVPEEGADRQFWEQRGISRVLAIAGDQESRRNIQTLMEDTGVLLDAVSGTAEALEKIPSGGFQLVLLDWDALGPESAAAVQALREALGDGVPILLLAEYGAQGMEEALAAARTGLLAKPFFVAALRERIAEMWADPNGEIGPEPEGPGSLEGLRLLAAEDNEINAEILAELLELAGASCEIVENGRLAVERFQSSAAGEFDAILMDVQMPVMNGHDATRAIRALSREDAGRIPIIAMTANAFAEDEKAARDAGMDAHVAKPLDVELLQRIINQHTRREETL
jgi:CheY-like chemotaxis protein